ncbi:hypothetical protein QBC38DRAFT_451337 [Podospora fimiseda]|uniref:Apple domain-containing protein n=1 Tax=Podospora fimiseda TaxID=252190 RepID=A0AAN7BXX0_9PEZI|nr:hypothetical protein QBC38DRAFT_451337 [Podospora fimiseda]
MAATYDTGLEPTRQDYPEVASQREPQQYHGQPYEQQQQSYQTQIQAQPYDQQHSAYSQPNQQWQQQWQQQQQPYQPSHPLQYTDNYHSHQSADTIKPENPFESSHSAPSSTYVSSPYSSHVQPAASTGSVRGAGGTTTKTAATNNTNKPVPILAMKICGCGILVFVLSCIIALLSAAVIGLSAATGIESQRANENESKLAEARSSLSTSTVVVTTSTFTATPTSLAFIDDGCAETTTATNGSTYVAYSQFGSIKFTRYCNRDAEGEVIYSLFTSSFSTCMDACAAYTMFIPRNFGNAEKATCTAVSFIPEWVDKAFASKSKAKGNCYMKAGPQNLTTLVVPDKTVDVHAAILAVGT